MRNIPEQCSPVRQGHVLQRRVALGRKLCHLKLFPHQRTKRLVVGARSRRFCAGLWRHITYYCILLEDNFSNPSERMRSCRTTRQRAHAHLCKWRGYMYPDRTETVCTEFRRPRYQSARRVRLQQSGCWNDANRKAGRQKIPTCSAEVREVHISIFPHSGIPFRLASRDPYSTSFLKMMD